MNKDGHVLNGLLLGIGLGFVLEPAGDLGTLVTVVGVTVPVVLGALFPDVDTHFGSHRKTLHNLPTLAVFLSFPLVFGNLQWVWVGVLTHYVLDVFGSKRGIALLYPYPREFGFPFGVATSSRFAGAVVLAVTAVELAVAASVVHYVPGALETAVRTVEAVAPAVAG
jgi:membrane-bound metal-dependent hydrolase YbcI (DUF457 family)